MKKRLQLWETAAATFVVLILAFSVLGARSPDGFAQVPYDSQSDTLGVANTDSVSRAFYIKGAKRIGIHVPTLTNASFNLRAGYDADSTFTLVWHAFDESQFSIGVGTGAFSIDVTELVAGFDYMQIWLGAAQGALRTFHVTIKY